MTGDLLAGLAERRRFALTAEPALPPLPGAPVEEGTPPQIASRLWDLLIEAKCNAIAPPARNPDPSLPSELAAVMAAAATFDLAEGLSLDNALWTRSGPYWNGEMAARLRDIAPLAGDARGLGLVLLYAQGAGRRAMLLGHAQPFVVEEEIAGPLTVPGPFLALVLCQIDPVGKAHALRGYAQPIVGSHCFMPVSSAFERDVFQALLALQVKLDAHGLECAINRPIITDGPERHIELRIINAAGDPQVLRINLNGSKRAPVPSPVDDETPYPLTPARFADGAFVAWLEERIIAPTTSK